MIVTFCGHSKVYGTEKVKEWLFCTVQELIVNMGATEFFIGGYGEFDRLALNVISEMRKGYPTVCSVLVSAYPNMKAEDLSYSEIIYPPLEHVPRKFAIVYRNRWMVERADIVVAYVEHNWGGAAATLAYAEKKKKRIISYNENR